jgi:sulfite exporter TauE/SafE
MVFVAGILGTAHCLGMCGPIALAIGSASQGWSSALAKQLTYTAGRVFTYGTLGAAAGFIGTRLVHVWPSIVNVPAMLAIVAGSLLVYEGLGATGLLRKWRVGGAAFPCMAGAFFGRFLRQPGSTGVFLAGVLAGFLPCGLLYGMLALAVSTRSVIFGGATMVVFGLGTAPAMILGGISGRLIGLAARRRLYAVAAWCLVLTGAISVGRGVSFLFATDQPASSCPMCAVEAQCRP